MNFPFARLTLLVAGAAISAIAFASSCSGSKSSKTAISEPAPQSQAAPVAPASPLVITSESPLPRADSGRLYSFTLQASGGKPPYNWSIPAGDLPLPNGLKLNSTGVIDGAPGEQSAIHSMFTFQVKDSAGRIATKNFELQSVAPLKLASVQPLPDGNVGLPYTFELSATGGVQPYTYSLANGLAPLPPGLALNKKDEMGEVQGTLAKSGKFSFTLQVSDSGTPQLRATQNFNLSVLKNVIIATNTLPVGVLNVPYSEPLKAVGGTPPYHWEIPGDLNSLPDELSLDSSTGIVSGTPRASGSSTFQVQVSDSAKPPTTRTQSIELTINDRMALRTFSLPDAARASAYHATISVVGGRPPYAVRLSSGKLPAGLILESTGAAIIVSGAPLVDGAFDCTLHISDSSDPPNFIDDVVRVRISEPLKISQADIPATFKQGQEISAAFSATGGIQPYTWTMSNIPPGLTFDTSTGALTGIATGAEKFTAVVTVRDSSNPPLSASTTISLQLRASLGSTPAPCCVLTAANSRIESVLTQSSTSAQASADGRQPANSTRAIRNFGEIYIRTWEGKSAGNSPRDQKNQQRRHPNG